MDAIWGRGDLKESNLGEQGEWGASPCCHALGRGSCASGAFGVPPPAPGSKQGCGAALCLTLKAPPAQHGHVCPSGSRRDRPFPFLGFLPLCTLEIPSAGAAPQVPRHGVPKRMLALSPNSPADTRGTLGKPCSPPGGGKSPDFTPFHALLPPRGLLLCPWGRGAVQLGSWHRAGQPGSCDCDVQGMGRCAPRDGSCRERGDVPRWVPLTSPSSQPSPSVPHPGPGTAASHRAGGGRGPHGALPAVKGIFLGLFTAC